MKKGVDLEMPIIAFPQYKDHSKVRRFLISLELRVGKKGTDIYPAIEIARSAITHSLQFLETNPI